MLKLLHFHIGSQLTDIKRIKNAMKEAARVYAKVYQMKVPVDLLDVGKIVARVILGAGRAGIDRGAAPARDLAERRRGVGIRRGRPLARF